MFVDSVEDKTEKISDKIICESCGKDFTCGANAMECWCFSIETKAETLAELRENYKNCLCEDCLVNLNKNNGEKEK